MLVKEIFQYLSVPWSYTLARKMTSFRHSENIISL